MDANTSEFKTTDSAIDINKETQAGQESEVRFIELLKSWDLENIFSLLKSKVVDLRLAKDFIRIFTVAGIGINELKYLSRDDIDRLFPSFDLIGSKAKFREELKNWKRTTVSMHILLLFYEQAWV